MSAIFSYLPRPGMLLAMLLAAAVFVLAAPAMQRSGESLAQQSAGSPSSSNPITVDAQGQRSPCSEIPEAKGGVLLGKIVPCLTKTIERTTQRMTKEMISWLMPTIWAFVTFVVVLFGVKILQGEGQIQTHGMVLLIKITLVMAFLSLIPDTIVPSVYTMMSQGQAIVMETVGPESGNSIKCDIGRYGDANTPLVWAQVDCIMGKLWGFTTGTDTNGNKSPNMLLASSVFGLLAGFFFGGTLGAVLFFACIGVLWSMFMLVMRIAMSFLNAYLLIALYLIIAPLFLPLVLLKVTTTYFDTWTKGIVAGLLLPVMICAYATLAFQIYDRMLFADDALVKNLFNHEWVQQAQQLPKQACNRELANNPAFRADASGRSENQIYNSHFQRNTLNPLLSSANDLCGGVRLPVFDLNATKDAKKFGEARGMFEALFQSMIKLLFLAWLVSEGFKVFVSSMRLVLGSGAAVQTLDATGRVEQQMRSGMAEAGKNFRGAFNGGDGDPKMGVSGAEFLRRLPGAIASPPQQGSDQWGGAFGGFMRGFKGR